MAEDEVATSAPSLDCPSDMMGIAADGTDQMSGCGPKRTSLVARSMSALPPYSDIELLLHQ